MNENERKKIYTLLSKFYPNARQLRDRATLTAWGYVLEKFTYDDVKSAVLDYASRNKFFPDLADLTGTLTPSTPKESTDIRHAPMSATERRDMALIRRWVEERNKELRAKGLPTMREATEMGMTISQWHRLLESKGAWD